MGGPYKRKKYHVGDTHLKKGWRTKRRTKDLDQVSCPKFKLGMTVKQNTLGYNTIILYVIEIINFNLLD